MRALTRHKGIVVPLDMANIDTDMIIPKQFLKSIERTGFGPYLFDELRYLDEGWYGKDCSQRPLNPDFPLNQGRYQGASVLLTRDNFGCGSSREHAPWALDDFGIRVIIAPSFADIFYNNCFKNGLLPIALNKMQVDRLFEAVAALPGYELDVDLPSQTITGSDGEEVRFDIDGFRKQCLLEGLDEIGLTLKRSDAIRAYEQKRELERPWLFNAIR